MVTLVSSFYNEEYLLPWWCEHHKNMFEQGVLFNYYSTDNSVKIIKKICPHWKIWETSNEDWVFGGNDNEFMRAEREFDGYKIVLTTTEFLVGKFPKLPKEPTCYGIPLKRIVDLEPNKVPTYDKPLVEQKHDSYKVSRDKYKRRFLHNYPDGRYYVGRHSTKLKHKDIDIDMEIYKYVFAPWNETFIKRKLSFKSMMNPRDVKRGRGEHHTWDRERLEREYVRACSSCAREE